MKTLLMQLKIQLKNLFGFCLPSESVGLSKIFLKYAWRQNRKKVQSKNKWRTETIFRAVMFSLPIVSYYQARANGRQNAGKWGKKTLLRKQQVVWNGANCQRILCPGIGGFTKNPYYWLPISNNRLADHVMCIYRIYTDSVNALQSS